MTRARTIAACDQSAIADLHYELGMKLANGTGSIPRPEGKAWNPNVRHFDFNKVQRVNHHLHNALDRRARTVRREMGEARWVELQAEWGDE